MYRGLMEEGDRRHEDAFAFQFEEPHFITLGLLYEKNARFAGGAYAPILRRVDSFLDRTLRSAYEVREERAARVAEGEEQLNKIGEKLKRRGIRPPYVKNFVLARTNPLYRTRSKTKPAFDTTLRRLIENLEAFDVEKIRYDEVARAGAYAAPAAG